MKSCGCLFGGSQTKEGLRHSPPGCPALGAGVRLPDSRKGGPPVTGRVHGRQWARDLCECPQRPRCNPQTISSSCRRLLLACLSQPPLPALVHRCSSGLAFSGPAPFLFHFNLLFIYIFPASPWTCAAAASTGPYSCHLLPTMVFC